MNFGGAPAFWWRPAGWQSGLLTPAAALYGAVAGRRLRAGTRASIERPVLCVGNFTAGGAGKTPTALALAEQARRAGLKAGFLSRGHGGSAKDALLVDPLRHGASETGDEPQLLAAVAPTVVARDRPAGAALLARGTDCDFIIMDDGFQSARLRADLALLVVDGTRGLGNGRVLPAGPLRAPLDLQLSLAGAVLIVGDGAAGDRAERAAKARGVPVSRGRLVPKPAPELLVSPLLAFAGIADPGKFYRSLREIGADVAETRDFPDHHPFAAADLAALAARADSAGLTLATTAKDAARLKASVEGRALLARTCILNVELALDEGAGPALIARALEAFGERCP